MGIKVKQILFIGLDTYGVEIANKIASIINNIDTSIGPFINFYDCYSDIAEFVKKQNEGKDKKEDSYSAVYKGISENENKLEKIIIEKIENIQKIKISNGIDDTYDHDESVNITILSSLFDSIGSSSLLPVTRIIQNIFSGRLKGSHYEINYLLFFPDLFSDSKNTDLNYIRSYCCLKEFDFILDNPDYLMPESFLPINYIFLFTDSNEKSEKLGTYMEIVPLLSEIVYLLMTKKIAKDSSFSSVLLSKNNNKTTRYSSLGFTKLVFPKEEIMQWLIADYKFQSIEFKFKEPEDRFEKSTIITDVISFYNENKMDRTEEELKRDKDGKSIYIEFKYQGKINDKVVVENFKTDISNQFVNFNQIEMTRIISALTNRKRELIEEKKEILKYKIRMEINNSSKSINYVSAFINVFLGLESPWIKGESVNEISNLLTLENRIYGYFSERMGFSKNLKNDLLSAQTKLKEKEKYFNNLAENKCEALEDKSPHNEGEISLKEKLSNEIDNTKETVNSLKIKSDEAETIINDPSSRKEHIENKKAENDEKTEKLFDELKEIDAKYKTEKSELDDLYILRNKFIVNNVILKPVIATVSIIVLLWISQMIIKYDSKMAIQYIFKYAYPISLVLYAIWIFIKFKKDILVKINLKKASIESIKTQKINKCISIQNSMKSFFDYIFNFTINDFMLDWIKEYKVFVKDMECGVQNYMNELHQVQKENMVMKDSIKFPNNVFIQSVINKEELQKIVVDRKAQNNYIEKFFIDNEFSKYFFSYLSDNDTILFEKEIEEDAREVYKEVEKTTIEEFLLNEYSRKNINVNERLAKLYENSSAFIRLDVEKGMDTSNSMYYLGVFDQNKSEIPNIFNANRMNLTPYNSASQYELSIAKLKLGFPAFHIGLVNYGKRLIKDNTLNKLPHIYDFEFDDLIPVNQEDLNESASIFYIGKIMQFIKEERKGYYYDDILIGNDINESILYLKSLRGNKIRLMLKKRIEKGMGEKGIIDVFENYKNDNILDKIEGKVLNDLIQKLNPLT